jgi:hypothetical protein
MSLGVRDIVRPAPARAVSPCPFGKERHAARSIPEPADVVEEEILQLVGTDDRFACRYRLRRALFSWNQLR